MSVIEVFGEEAVDNHIGVSDPRYNKIDFFGGLFRPVGLDHGLIIRGLRGGALILDPVGKQIYRPVAGRVVGPDDYVCATLNTLWALHDRHHLMEREEKSGIRRICVGYGRVRDHTGLHHFGKKDLLLLYLRHRLRLRVLLARSKVFFSLPICPFVLNNSNFFQKYSAEFFRELYTEHFPHAGMSRIEEECKWTLKSMDDSLSRAADDGILFAERRSCYHGPAHQLSIGEGPVRRSDSVELLREFCNLEDLHLYASCYEWTHWRAVMSALGNFLTFFSLNFPMVLNWYFHLSRSRVSGLAYDV